jgi:putative acetyltransferase
MPLILEHLPSPTPHAITLLTALDAELNAAYTPDQRHGLSLANLFQPHILFFIAYLNNEPAGCGGVAFYDGLAELKRMYVRPHLRGQRVAQSLLSRLEQEARERQVRRLVLETGDAQLAALRFYQRAGFTRCSAFGPYATMPAASIVRSIFLEKSLA